MLCKAIIEEVINSYSARVRIPIYHKISGSAFATNTRDLPIASICTVPGVHLALKAGDVVFVDFELDHRDMPVILGVLAHEDVLSSCDLAAQSIKATVSCDLPKDTYYSTDDELRKINLDSVIEQLTTEET